MIGWRWSLGVQQSWTMAKCRKNMKGRKGEKQRKTRDRKSINEWLKDKKRMTRQRKRSQRMEERKCSWNEMEGWKGWKMRGFQGAGSYDGLPFFLLLSIHSSVGGFPSFNLSFSFSFDDFFLCFFVSIDDDDDDGCREDRSWGWRSTPVMLILSGCFSNTTPIRIKSLFRWVWKEKKINHRPNIWTFLQSFVHRWFCFSFPFLFFLFSVFRCFDFCVGDKRRICLAVSWGRKSIPLLSVSHDSISFRSFRSVLSFLSFPSLNRLCNHWFSFIFRCVRNCSFETFLLLFPCSLVFFVSRWMINASSCLSVPFFLSLSSIWPCIQTWEGTAFPSFPSFSSIAVVPHLYSWYGFHFLTSTALLCFPFPFLFCCGDDYFF